MLFILNAVLFFFWWEQIFGWRGGDGEGTTTDCLAASLTFFLTWWATNFASGAIIFSSNLKNICDFLKFPKNFPPSIVFQNRCGHLIDSSPQGALSKSNNLIVVFVFDNINQRFPRDLHEMIHTSNFSVSWLPASSILSLTSHGLTRPCIASLSDTRSKIKVSGSLLIWSEASLKSLVISFSWSNVISSRSVEQLLSSLVSGVTTAWRSSSSRLLTGNINWGFDPARPAGSLDSYSINHDLHTCKCNRSGF